MPGEMAPLIAAAAAWLAGLCVARAVEARDFRRSPQKKARHAALPLAYRLACPLGVVPLFTGVPVFLYASGLAWQAGLVLLVAPAGLLAAELAAIRWYRKAGLL